MPPYRKPNPKVTDADWTKFKTFKLVETGFHHRGQKASGRTAILNLAKDGMTIDAWAKACAKEGYDTAFVVSSLDKHMGSPTPRFVASETNADGLSWKEVKALRKRAKAGDSGSPDLPGSDAQQAGKSSRKKAA